jgi:hypothetical protein
MIPRTYVQTALTTLALAMFSLALPACQFGLTLEEEGLTGSLSAELDLDQEIQIEVITGSGVPATEAREVALFDEIETHGSVSVEVTIGDGPALEISGDDNLLQYTATDVVGGRLIIRGQGGETLSPVLPLVVRVTVPDVRVIETHGASDVTVAELDNAGIRLETHGGTTVRLAGATDSLTIETHGGSDVNAEALTARAAEVVTHGGSDVKVYVTETLDIVAHGGSSIRYAGGAEVTLETHGNASVTQIDG